MIITADSTSHHTDSQVPDFAVNSPESGQFSENVFACLGKINPPWEKNTSVEKVTSNTFDKITTSKDLTLNLGKYYVKNN